MTFGPQETEDQFMINLIKKQREQLQNRSNLNEQIEGTKTDKITQKGKNIIMERQSLTKALKELNKQQEIEKKKKLDQYTKLRSVWEEQAKQKQNQVKVDFEIESDHEDVYQPTGWQKPLGSESSRIPRQEAIQMETTDREMAIKIQDQVDDQTTDREVHFGD